VTQKTREEIFAAWRASMLRKLDQVRRRVETGELHGLVLVAEREDGSCVASRSGMPMGSVSIVVIHQYLREIENDYIERNMAEDKGAPNLAVHRGQRLGLAKRHEHGTLDVQRRTGMPGDGGDGDGAVPVLRAPTSPEEAEALAQEAERLRDEFDAVAAELEKTWEDTTPAGLSRRNELAQRQRTIWKRQKEIHAIVLQLMRDRTVS